MPSAPLPSACHTPRCRICYDSSDSQPGLGRLIRPCNCSGSVALVHEGCLNRWMEGRGSIQCELCHHDYEVLNCGLKQLRVMSLPRPLDDDFESRFEFAFLALWIIDTAQLIGHGVLQGPEGFRIHLTTRFGHEGWFFYVGCFCTCVNLLYYGAVLTLVIDQWLWENSVFVLKDRNSLREREEIVAKLRNCASRASRLEFVTCKKRQLKTD